MNSLPSSEIAGLVLAAGASKRMGRPKQLLPWKGTTLMEYAIYTIQGLVADFKVVLGSQADEIVPLVPSDKVLINTNWESGMGSSLALGVHFFKEKSEAKAILVILVDQPLLELEHYKDLMRSYVRHPKNISCSSYDGRPGVPAIFPRSFFEGLMELNGDFGARRLLNEPKTSLLKLEPKGRLIDLDTLEDYESAFSEAGL